MSTQETLVKYDPVHPSLKEVVNAYVLWRRTADHRENKILLPNNIAGFGITLRGAFYVKEDKDFRLMPQIGTRNTMDLPRETYTSGDFLNISVRMKMPQGLHRFIKVPVYELFRDGCFDLRDIFKPSEMETLIVRLEECKDDREMILLLEQFLLQKLNPHISYFYAALVHFIHQKRGVLTIYDIARHFSVSERSVHRLFLHHAGISPKAYIDLIRFRNIIHASTRSAFNPLEAALDSGFYDQSHFIKLFRKLSSTTPGKFFSSAGSGQVSDFYNF